MKTISGDLTYRVKFASACLMRPPKGGMRHSFDNCFEMGDGDEVVRRILRNAKKNPRLAEALRRYRVLEQWGMV